MNAATVASAVNSTMLIAPTMAVIANTRGAVIRSVCPAATSGVLVSVEKVSFTFDQTSIDPSVRYRIPIAIIQTKNITIDTIRLIFSTVHGSTRFSCSDASRGGRRAGFARRAFSEPGRGGTVPLGRGPGGGPTCCGLASPFAPDPASTGDGDRAPGAACAPPGPTGPPTTPGSVVFADPDG